MANGAQISKIDRLLLPQGTRRYHFYDTVMRGLRFIINRGFGSFLMNLKYN